MPRTPPIGAAAVCKRASGGVEPILLLDVETADGTLYYLTDFQGSYPMVLGAGGNAAYIPWLKRIDRFTSSRSSRTDGGDIFIQNLSGLGVVREVAAALDAHEFEGALAVLRFWKLEISAALERWDGTLGEQSAQDDEIQVHLGQLMNPNEDQVPLYSCSEQCIWRYKSPQCGSTSGLATCSKTRADCVTRGAIERFSGIPITGQVVRDAGTYIGGGTGGLTGGTGSGDGGPGGGGTIGIDRD